MIIALHLAAGLLALYYGAEWLVRGGASLAVRLGVTPLLVGLTVVAYGTSTPELIVSSMSALEGRGDIAIGNAVGSNIFNIGVILGMTALLRPMTFQSQLLRFDLPVMVGTVVLFLVCFLDRAIQRWEALLFLLGIIVYSILNVRMARLPVHDNVRREYEEEMPRSAGALGRDLFLIVGGLVILVVGSRLFVDGAVGLARLLAWSEAIIGLTIVAAGTSLPELASSLMAAWRRHPDMAIGNVVGSCIYNILAILGVGGVLASPLDATGVSLRDGMAMVGISMILLVLVLTGQRLQRWHGALLLGLYSVYLGYLLTQRPVS